MKKLKSNEAIDCLELGTLDITAGVQRMAEAIRDQLVKIRDVHCVVAPVLNGAAYLGVDISRALTGLGVEHYMEPLMTNLTHSKRISKVVCKARSLDHIMDENPTTTIVVVDTICDSGRTFQGIKDVLSQQYPYSTLMFTSLFLRCRPMSSFNPHYSAYHLDHMRWLTGYGMDILGKQRGLIRVYSAHAPEGESLKGSIDDRSQGRTPYLSEKNLQSLNTQRYEERPSCTPTHLLAQTGMFPELEDVNDDLN
jgi:hypoxanthine-guanine phosphoribosyltransferase